jgi:hypothetical protein
VLILEEHVWWMRQQKLWGSSRTCSIAGTRCLLYDGIHSHGTTYLTKSEDARSVYEKASSILHSTWANHAMNSEIAKVSPRRGGTNVFSQVSLS